MEDIRLVHRPHAAFYLLIYLSPPPVKTGKYRAGDETRPGVVPPDEVFDSFAEFIDNLLLDRVSNL